MKSLLQKIFGRFTFKKTFFALTLFFIPIAAFATEFTEENSSLDFAGLLIANNILLPIINFLGGTVLVMMINKTEVLFAYNNFLGANAVAVGWPVVRDLCNMFFVVILLMIAFSTILNISSYHYKSSLPKLLLIAVLINFSKTIMGLMIDFAQVIMLTFVGAFKPALASNLVSSFGLTDMLTITPTGSQFISQTAIMVSLMLAVAFLVVAVAVMLAYVAVLLYRIISIWIAVILSPLAFFLSAFPAGKKYASEFWSTFIKQLTTGAILAFFMWLALTILAVGSDTLNSNFNMGENAPNKAQSQYVTGSNYEDLGNRVYAGDPKEGGSKLTGWDKMFTFIVAIALLLMALKYAGEAGGFAGKFAGKVSGSLSKMGGWAAMKFTGAGFVANRYKSYRKHRKDEKEKKIQQFGASLAALHGGAEKWVGGKVGRPFQKVKEGIKEKIGFTAFKEKIGDFDKRTKALKDAEKLRENAKKNTGAAAALNGELNTNKSFTEAERTAKMQQAAELSDTASNYEQQALWRLQGYSAEEAKLKTDARKKRREAGKEKEGSETEKQLQLRADELDNRAESQKEEREAEEGVFEPLAKPTTLAELEDERKVIEARKGKTKEGSIEWILAEEELVQQEAKIKQAKANLKEKGITEDSDKYNNTETSVEESEESINIERKRAAHEFLTEKKNGIWALMGTRTFHDSKAEAAEFMQSQLSYEGNMDLSEKYGELAKEHRKTSKYIGFGTAAAAAGAVTVAAPMLGASVLGTALVAGAAMSPRFVNWQAKRFRERGHRQKNLADGWKYTEIKHEMDNMKDMHITQIRNLADNKDGTVPVLQQIAAILKSLEEGFISAEQVESTRAKVRSLGADERTISHLEAKIFEAFPNFVEDVKKELSIADQIELGIIDPRKVDSSALLAKNGELAAELALNLTYQGWMSAIQKSKRFKDNAVMGVMKKMQEWQANGDFEDASRWGELGKILNRYCAAGKKDTEVQNLLLDANGNMAHEGFWNKVLPDKDAQNMLAYIRWDEIEKDYMEKYGNTDGERKMNTLVAKFAAKTKVDHWTSGLKEAALNGDSPSQAGAAVLLKRITKLYKQAITNDAQKTDLDNLRNFLSSVSLDTTEVENAVNNLKQVFGLFEGIADQPASLLHGLYGEFAVYQGNKLYNKKNTRPDAKKNNEEGVNNIIPGTAQSFKESKQNYRGK